MIKKETKIERVDLKSINIVANQKEKLRQLFPEVFTEDKVNFDKLKKTLGESLDETKERYELNWAGKTNCFKIIQDQSLMTLNPVPNESINWDKTQNLFIEGDNFEVLKLLQKSYNGKVKMIYTDPPYNTGTSMIYSNDFSQSEKDYEEDIGAVDENGNRLFKNTITNGRFHSNWLSMMYERIFLARDLLTDDGFFVITIDHNELANLTNICDEIFGEDNRLGIVTVVIRPQGRQFAKFFSSTTEFMLVYAKDYQKANFNGVVLDEERKEEYGESDEKGIFKYEPLMYSRFVEEKLAKAKDKYFYPIYVSKDLKEITLDKKEGYFEVWPINKKRKICWKVQKETFRELLKDKRDEYSALKDKEGNVQVYEKYREEDGTKIKTHWIGKRYNATTSGTGVLKEILGENIFSYPKALYAVLDTLKIMSNKDDLILDFFAGSSTTAHAVMQLNLEDGGNRKFIMVQLPEMVDKDSDAFKEGYKHIADISKERIRRVIKKIKDEQKEAEKQKKLGDENKSNNLDLGFKVFKLEKSNFKIWDSQTKDIQTALNEHINPIRKESSQDDVLYELILKSGLSLTTDIKEIKIGNKKVFSIEDGMLLICLEKELTSELIKKIAELKPARFYCLDEGFKGNDQLKANAVEIFKNVETVDGEKIVFRTV